MTAALRDVVDNAFAKISRRELTSVDFVLDENRVNPVRDDVMAIAFGKSQAPKTAAARLADRLGRAMDERSQAGLVLTTVEANAASRRVSILLLPREDVVQLNGTDDEMLLSLLRDAFSTASGLRKLARMEGQDAKTQFLSASVLDLQLLSAQKSAADFWVSRFLQARPRIDSVSGSKQLAAALQRAFDVAQDDDKDAVFAALFKASSGRVRRTSLSAFADELPEALRDQYFRGVDREEVRAAVFDVDREVIKAQLARRIITGRDGVVISAPTATVGKTVELATENAVRMVRYEGEVAKERMTRGTRSDRQ